MAPRHRNPRLQPRIDPDLSRPPRPVRDLKDTTMSYRHITATEAEEIRMLWTDPEARTALEKQEANAATATVLSPSTTAGKIALFQAAKAEVDKIRPNEVLELLTAAFDANPRVKGYVWYQYTPYFNDGEPCTFGVHADRPARSTVTMAANEDWEWIAGSAPTGVEVDAPVDEEGEESDSSFLGTEYEDSGLKIQTREWRSGVNGRYGEYVDIPHDPEAIRQCAAVDKVFDSIPETVMKNLGDGYRFYAWRGGIARYEYSHD